MQLQFYRVGVFIENHRFQHTQGFFEKFLTYTLSTQKFQIRL